MADSIKGLPIDVFELMDEGLNVNSLTAGHGMDEVGASTNCFCYPCCSCSAPSSSA
ncbi:thiomuracin/GE37468 family thiazolyl RiPP peptide [Cryobacterium sp. N21]|uniref:thiomuracin/GE37468 family thiazolyl RiPP peptide n=1 Tax=Cryobacterium sp. N21 TaxID=2048289 RepID=UPI000CE2C5F2|nr:thiomuracin/GE37468 family thiazolyl RiPP peptide [Cryobacterium sp. N21]